MLKKINKNFLVIFSLFLISSTTLLLSGCSFGGPNKIYVANFESYINPVLRTEIENHNNVDYKVFSTNEQAERGFTKNHHISIPSSYVGIKLIREGKVEPINWPLITNDKIGDAEIAKAYFTDDIQTLLTSYDLDGDGLTTNPKDNLLYWGIPYFAQDLVIGYKPETPDAIINDGLPLKDVILELSAMTGKNKEYNRMAVIDDTRTMFGFANVIEGSATVNPLKDETSINDFSHVYRGISNNLNNNKVVFNTDSGNILNDFASDRGSDIMIAYNGDLLYATFGGDSGIEPEKKIEVYRPNTGSITQALDMIIVNKDLYGKLNSSGQANIWDIVRKIGFDIPQVISPEGLEWEDSWSYINFDFVNYTPVIKGLYDYILLNYSLSDIQLKILKTGPIKQELIDRSISDEQQFNMQYAYMKAKSEM